MPGTHLVAFHENLDTAVLAEIQSVVDDVLTRPDADRLQVPPDFNALHACAALASNVVRAQIRAPSLEVKRATLEILPHERGADLFTLDGPRYHKPYRQIEFDPGENLMMYFDQDAGAADRLTGLIWLKKPGDLPAPPAGALIPARAVGATTLVAWGWTTCTVVLDKELEAGEYALVGFVPISATGIAARVIIPGQVERPGVPVMPGAEEAGRDYHPDWLADFGFYEMGRFRNTSIPQFQFLAGAGDTAQYVVMYLVKVG